MKLQEEASLFGRAGICQMLLIAIVYGGLIHLNIYFFRMFYGVELRLATFVPVVGGLIFGLPAAVGAFLGNLAALLFTADSLSYILCTCIGNFLLAYFPYRYWYGYQSKKATMYVYNNRTYVKLMNILALNSLHFTMVMSPLFMLYYNAFSLAAVCLTFANNFFFPVIFGVPILMLWSKYSKVRYYRPADKVRSWCRFGIFAHAMLLILDFFVLWFAYQGKMHDTFACFVVVAGLLLYILLVQIPSSYKVHQAEKMEIQTVSSRILYNLFGVVDFMLIICMISAFNYSFRYPSSWYVSSNWLQLVQELFWCLVIMSFGMYVFLWYIEKKVIYPLHKLHRQVDEYHDTGDISKLQEIAAATQISQVRGKDEISVLAFSLQKMGLDIDKYLQNLDNMIMEQQQFSTQMEIANAIQQGVLPQLTQLQDQLPGYKIYGAMEAAKSIGGDMYDAFLLDEDHLIIVVADVSGKGVPASLFMMLTQALVKENAKAMPPGQAIAKTNESLSTHNEQCLFVTMWLALVELSTGKLQYVNAGHNPPLLFHKTEGQVEWIRSLSGPVLGLMAGTAYEEYTMQLAPGDRLLVYTDGLNEAENMAGQFYGNDRLEHAFTEHALPKDLLAEIKTFAAGAEQSDDMTYIWLERQQGVAK